MRDMRETALTMQDVADVSGAGSTQLKAVPFDCELVLVAINFSALLATTANAPLTFAVFVNGVTTATSVIVPDAEGADASGGLYPLDGKVFMAAGDGLRLTCGGENIAVVVATITAILKPT